MPSFREHVETLADWRRFPGRERLDGSARRFALSFDDGPDPDGTPAVLGALQSEDAVATFFLVGEQVEAHPELARRIASGGHAIGLHCHQHRRHSELGEGVADDLRRGLAAIEGATGVRPRLWRPPYGRFTERSFSACREARLEPVYWSAWGWDWEEIAAERIAELALRDLGPGAIVLLHDSARYAHRRDAAPTAEAVSAVLKRAREAGLEPAPLA